MEPQPGFYRHYNNKKLYEYLGIGTFTKRVREDEFYAMGIHSETYHRVYIYKSRPSFVLEGQDTSGLDFVVYQAQYDDEEFGEKPIFVRPKDMFLEVVSHKGIDVPRFEYLGEEKPAE